VAHDRRIRFALQAPRAADGAAWGGLARRAEDLGFSVLSLPDHLGDQFSPIPALAWAAAAAPSIRLGMFVLANDFRHPGILARDVATLDVLSGGRVELGLGAGWEEAEYRALGIAFDRPGERIERLAEAASLIRRALAGERVSARGRHYHVEELTVLPAVAQPGGVPLVLGGGGRRILTLAGSFADIVSIATDNRSRQGRQDPTAAVRTSAVRRQVEWVREGAGERFDDVELNIRVLAVGVGVDRGLAAGAAATEAGWAVEDVVDSPFALVGSTEDIAAQILRQRDDLGISYYTVSLRHAAALAGVLEAIAGR